MKKKIFLSLKRRELYFVIIVYPFFLFCVDFFNKLFKNWVGLNYNFYAFTSFGVFIFILILVFSDIGLKLYSDGIQGDKLKIREKEGLNISQANKK